MAIQKVVDGAVTEGWLEATPVLHWDTLAEEPEKTRLNSSKWSSRRLHLRNMIFTQSFRATGGARR